MLSSGRLTIAVGCALLSLRESHFGFDRSPVAERSYQHFVAWLFARNAYVKS